MSRSRAWRGLSLACPRCRGSLIADPAGAACTGCGTRYSEEEGMLHLVAGSIGGAAYDPDFFETLRSVEERHFWFLGRRRVILDALRRTVPDLASRPLFDIGSGTGALLSFLADHGVPIAGACDAHAESLRLIRERLDIPLVLVDEGRHPPLGSGHRLLGMFDVLEHLDDDAGVLAALREALLPGGYLALTVPAGPNLFNDMDDLAGHRRRYTRDGLRRRLEDAGFRVLLLNPFMSLLLPPLVVTRRLALPVWRARPLERGQAELRVVPGLNGAMRLALALERALARIAPPPFGSSLVAVATRVAP